MESSTETRKCNGGNKENEKDKMKQKGAAMNRAAGDIIYEAVETSWSSISQKKCAKRQYEERIIRIKMSVNAHLQCLFYLHMIATLYNILQYNSSQFNYQQQGSDVSLDGASYLTSLDD